MPLVTVYFHDDIKLIDVMRAAEHIGCTIEGDIHGGALLVVPKREPNVAPTEHPLPNWLKRQAE